MAIPQDASIGIGVESVFKTPVTATRWFEQLGNTFDFNPVIKQGMGMRVGSRVARSGRRVVTDSTVGGGLTLEALSKGMGLLWQAALGTGTSTLVSGSTFQQLFTLGDSPSSLTVQVGSVQAGATVDPTTFAGCMVSDWGFNFPNADICNAVFNFAGVALATATAYTTPSGLPPATASLFSFAGGSIASGTLTAPTATALASGTTVLADIRGGSLKVANNLSDRPNIGGRAKPTMGLREISGTITAEYDTVAYRDAFINQTPAMVILNYVGEALSTGTAQLQIVIPEYKLDGSLPQVNGSDLVTTDFNFTGLDNLTAAQPIWVVARTSDAAL